MTLCLVSLNVALALQEQRIRQALLTRREDLPETMPTPLRAHDVSPSVPRSRHQFSDEDIAMMRTLSRAGMRYTVIGRRFHVNHEFVSAVCKSDPKHRRYVGTERKYA